MGMVQLVGLVALALCGTATGRWLSRREKLWTIGYALPMVLILGFAACRWVPSLGFRLPFTSLLAWRCEFVTMTCALSILFSTVIPKLPKKSNRVGVSCFAVVCGAYFLMPFLFPVMLHARHLDMHGTADKSGVCLQSTAYTCGPASVVAALARHGIATEEGTVAIETYCNPLFGTQAETISKALNRHYVDRGIRARHRQFDSPEELPRGVPVVIAIKYSFMVDHFVAVTRTAEDRFEIIDPLNGKSVRSAGDVADIWRSYGVVVERVL